MRREEAFDAWAPPNSVWSAWAKPVLFAHLPEELPAPLPEPEFDLSWLPPAAERFARVSDLPGATSVAFGLATTARGYRPVPLFNGLPQPATYRGEPTEPAAVVDVLPTLFALAAGAERLRSLSLPSNAPPVFLLDANRQTPVRPLTEGAFDNRSVVFVTDFPSAALLKRNGIDRVILVRDAAIPLGRDLTYALQVWQQGGISLFAHAPSGPEPVEPLRLPRPGWFTGLRLRLAALFSFRRDSSGGFGSFIPTGDGG